MTMMPNLGTYGEGYADGLLDGQRDRRQREIATDAATKAIGDLEDRWARAREPELAPEPARRRLRDRVHAPYWLRSLAMGWSMGFLVSAGAWTFLHEIAGVKL